jgi:hypothetical protein
MPPKKKSSSLLYPASCMTITNYKNAHSKQKGFSNIKQLQSAIITFLNVEHIIP